MTVLLGVAAFGIDAATWMATHHRVQVGADAAAMAAADCLANPGHSGTIVLSGTQTTVPACSSSSDTTDADTVAIDYAAANGLTISSSNVIIANNTVTVTGAATSSGVFSKIAGIASTSQSAGAGASWINASNLCTSPGSGCDFMFADNSNCSSSSNGIAITASGNSTVSGNIQSNGNLGVTASGNISLGAGGSYGPNGTSTCSSSDTYSGHNPWSSAPTQAAQDIPFPIDYTQDFPACGNGSGQSACQTNGYPSFCTNAGASITLDGSTNGDTAITNNIYCASGSGQPSKPSTWNGTITISMSGNNTLYDTFVGGSISFTGSGKDTVSSCGYAGSGYTAANCSSTVPAPTTANYPIFYATGTSSTAINVTVSGSQTLNGDLFAPKGTASLSMSGNKTLTTFIEANNISATMSGTLQGDGPAATNTGSSAGGTVQLVQ